MEPPNPRATFAPFCIPRVVLDDLCSRFIINVPEEERADLIRIFFQIELAHWFYLDFYCNDDPDLKPIGIKEFSAQTFTHCPFLRNHVPQMEQIFDNWKEYKMAVPTYGAIMVNPSRTRVVMVQGYWARSSWMFPKGKVNEDEQPHDCAVREVLEETSFDIGRLIDHEAFLEFRMNDQLSRLYLIENVPDDTAFEPKTRQEIKHIEWFPIEYLPTHKKDNSCKEYLSLNPNSFFMVIPFIKQIRLWCQARAKGEPYDFSSAAKQSQRKRSTSARSVSVSKKDEEQQQQQVKKSSRKAPSGQLDEIRGSETWLNFKLDLRSIMSVL